MIKNYENELLLLINKEPLLLSLLCDLDLLPEQLEEGSREWAQMLVIADHWNRRFKPTEAKVRGEASITPPNPEVTP